MVNPVVDVVAGVTPGRRTLRILPVYPASAKAGLTSWEIGECVEEALRRAGKFVDPLPPEWRSSLDLWGRTEAFGAIHLPELYDVVAPARRRLVFDELFRLQLARRCGDGPSRTTPVRCTTTSRRARSPVP